MGERSYISAHHVTRLPIPVESSLHTSVAVVQFLHLDRGSAMWQRIMARSASGTNAAPDLCPVTTCSGYLLFDDVQYSPLLKGTPE